MAGGEEFAHVFGNSGHDNDGNLLPAVGRLSFPAEIVPRFFGPGNSRGNPVVLFLPDEVRRLISARVLDHCGEIMSEDRGEESQEIWRVVHPWYLVASEGEDFNPLFEGRGPYTFSTTMALATRLTSCFTSIPSL